MENPSNKTLLVKYVQYYIAVSAQGEVYKKPTFFKRKKKDDEKYNLYNL